MSVAIASQEPVSLLQYIFYFIAHETKATIKLNKNINLIAAFLLHIKPHFKTAKIVLKSPAMTVQ